MDGLQKTREEVIDLSFKVLALERKAACRQVNCEVLDMLAEVSNALNEIDNKLTEIIGD